MISTYLLKALPDQSIRVREQKKYDRDDTRRSRHSILDSDNLKSKAYGFY